MLRGVVGKVKRYCRSDPFTTPQFRAQDECTCSTEKFFPNGHTVLNQNEACGL